MHVNVVWLAALALSLPVLSQCDPLHVLSAPNLLRVGSKETVFLEVQDYSGPSINVEIVAKDFPAKNREINSNKGVLNAENKFQILLEIQLSEEFFEEETHLQQYVVLQAIFGDPNNQKIIEKIILVSFQSGYIFVQTDKSIYTPISEVLYRVFALNPGLEPITSGVSVEIMTPEGITVQKDIIQPDGGVKSGQYKLPEVASVGIWKVVCKFQNTPQKNFTADFEVKEYVLPSFEVKLKTEKSFFYVDDEELSVDITARYLFGKDVSGKAFVLFGALTKGGQKLIFPASLQKATIDSGKGKAKLTRAQILKTSQNIKDLASLYMSVSVLTESGSEMVQAEKTGILVVTSPYTIHFTKTPSYFKPGMPFQVVVYVTNPDNSPAQDIDVTVKPGDVSGRTQKNGVAKLNLNTEGNAASLPITVRTNDPTLTVARQAEARMTAQKYNTKQNSNNYMHISIQAGELEIGANLQINLNTGNSPGIQGKKKDFTYLVLNKGQLVQAARYERQPGQSLVTLSMQVTKDMVPSFRIVAYYHVGTEVVSDSLWVDVKDTCMGKLEVTSTKPKDVYEPRKQFSLTITGDPGAKVGLVAVDRGVYVLNNKNRLTQTKIWDVVEKHDIGCTPGSGADSMGVFFDAGLAFQTSTFGTPSRSNPLCPVKPSSRRRRSLTLTEVKDSLASKYTGLERECCVDGMAVNLRGLTCQRRSRYISDGEACVKAFLHCCLVVENKTEEAKAEKTQVHARSSDDDYYISDTNIVSRTQFPESWLWEEVILPGCPPGKQGCTSTSTIKKSYMKDSITTWEITAISLSKTHGICVADSFPMTVRKNFFIDLKLPYSAVRNEQLEIKAVVYNYLEEQIRVRVELMETPQVCSAASKQRKFRMPDIYVDAMSSYAVPFVIIPMALGLHSIEVKAAVYDSIHTDGVEKDLLVVAEGVQTTKQITTIILNPSQHGGEQKQNIAAVNISSRVPGSPAQTYISVAGEVLSQTIQAAISGKPLGSLIHQPGGCGEQNMISMTGPLIATHYLDKSGQWEQVGVDRRAEAIKFIRMGYTQQLAYLVKDGAFSVWVKGSPSSWLTAYVVKVFSMAYDLIDIDVDVLCGAVKWLVLNTQQPDGIFKEVGKVIHGEMVGGVRGKDSETSMTAFVLIAMQEARHICIQKVNSLEDSMKLASDYLSDRIKSLTNPYAVTLTAYALANEGKHQLDILNRFSSGNTHWPVPASHFFTLEASGYALMALVKAREFDQAGQVVKWLTEKRFYGGGYGSTQATTVVFQAVAMYMKEISAEKDVDLQVSLDVAGRAKAVKWTYTKSNIHLTRSEKIRIDQDLKVTAKGTGQGTMSVVTIYNALPEEKKTDCKNFELKVLLEKEPKVTVEDALETYKLTIDMLYLSKSDATMSILDITMLTGFIADKQDLDRLTSGRDRYVQKIEADKQLSEKGSLIFYLDQVSHELPDRVVFKIHKMSRVGLLQPAAITLYEYYSMENRCMKFYHPEKKDGALNRICHQDVCRCAEEKCSYQRKQGIEELDRMDTACSAGMDYVYKARVVKSHLSQTIDRFTVLVEDVIKEGTESGVKGKRRTFMAHPFCRDAISLREGKSYLVMGKSDDLVKDEEGVIYMLGEDTWIEYWPTEQECQEPDFSENCVGIKEATADLVTFGCPT